jgi:hypothetical protein
MIRFVAQIGLMIAIVALSMGVVSAQNDDETLTFPLVINGDRIQAQFTAEYDSQIYAFVASSGDRVTVHMAQDPATSPLDPFLLIFDSAGVVIASDDDGGDTPYFSALIQNLQIQKDGVYYILTTHKDSLRRSLSDTLSASELEDGLNYTLTLTGNTPPVNFDMEEASITPANLTSAQSIDLASNQALGLVAFIGDDKTFTFETSNVADGNIDTILLLFDAEGQRIAVNDDEPSLGLLSRIEAELEADSAYLLIVTAYQYERTAEASFAWESEGTITLNASSR